MPGRAIWRCISRTTANNGPGYRKNSYDTKLEAAHRRFLSEAEKAAKPAQPGSGKGLP